MTEPRKPLPRGANLRTAVVDAARAFVGDSDPRGSSARVVGDPVHQVLGGSVEGLRADQAGRRYGSGFHAAVHAAARQAVAAPQQKAPAAPAADAGEDDGLRAHARGVLDSLSPEEFDAFDRELDERRSAEILAAAEQEPPEWSWEPTPQLPWEHENLEKGYYSETGQKFAESQRDWYETYTPEAQPEDTFEWQDEFGEEDEAA